MEITTKEPIPIADKVNKDTVSGSIKISSENEEVNTLANIRYRGNTSLKFVKKGYNLKLIDNKGKDNKQEILGMSKNDEWVLHGPYIDKTLIRNYMWYNIVGQIMEYSPGCRYVELFVNNQYQGLYLLVEKINVSEYGRLKIEPIKENSKTSSFLIEQTQKNTSIEGTKNRLNNFSHYTLIEEQTTEFEVHYPTSKKLTTELKEYINDYLSAFEKSIYSYDYDTKRYGYHKYIDVNNFVDYFVLSEVTMNNDSGTVSTYIYKDVKGKMKLVIWDMNNSFDNYFRVISSDNFVMKDKLWFSMLLKDESFVNLVINRYRKLRKDILSDKYLEDYIDETIAYLGDSIERNYSRWGDSFSDDNNFMIPKTRNIHSYKEAVNQLKTTMKKRLDWLDKNIESLHQFSHESSIKNYNP